MQTLLGLVNGNQGVFSTCLGEITDESNQARAFKYLPVIYGAGAITGPAVGGLLVDKTNMSEYPYLGPNLFAAGALLVEFILTAFMLDETLEEAKNLPSFSKRIRSMAFAIWQWASSIGNRLVTGSGEWKRQSANGNAYRRVATSSTANEDDAEEHANGSTSATPTLFPTANNEQLAAKDVFNRDTVLLLITFLIFQLSNIAYNSLYPIFGQADPPIGRNLSPEEIGLSLAFAGIITIVFQIGGFEKSKEKYGSRLLYAFGHLGLALAFILMPWVTYKGERTDASFTKKKVGLWVELGIILILKTAASIGALTSALLLVSFNQAFMIVPVTTLRMLCFATSTDITSFV